MYCILSGPLRVNYLLKYLIILANFDECVSLKTNCQFNVDEFVVRSSRLIPPPPAHWFNSPTPSP